MLLDCLLELGDLAFTESLHHKVEPLEIGAFQRVNYVFIQEFGDIEHILAKEDRHAHLDRELTLLLLTKVSRWCICQVLQAALVVVLMIILSLVIETINKCKVRVNFRINV